MIAAHSLLWGDVAKHVTLLLIASSHASSTYSALLRYTIPEFFSSLLNNTPSTSDAPGVEKIRELLFGNQMQDYDRRFEVIEQRFQQKMRDQEAESTRALQSMESSVKKQLESIAGQVRQEQDLRAEADKELAAAFGNRSRDWRSTSARLPTSWPAWNGTSPRDWATNRKRCAKTSGAGTKTLAQP
jgi:hypothetical protein